MDLEIALNGSHGSATTDDPVSVSRGAAPGSQICASINVAVADNVNIFDSSQTGPGEGAQQLYR